MAQSIRLRIVRGPRAGEVFEVGDRESVLVGRSPQANLSIDSPGLSRQHFELRWDGAHCWLRDLNSRNGVSVNGQRVAESVVRNGDMIEAAETAYVLEISTGRRRIIPDDEPATADVQRSVAQPPAVEDRPQEETVDTPLAVFENVEPSLSGEAPSSTAGTLSRALLRACESIAGTRLYALIDGAQAFELAFTARLMGNHLYTLFNGALAADLAHVGPCLVELSKPEPFVEKWVEAVGTHAGILLQTRASLQDLYGHLRRIFIVTDEGSQEYFFRYYDPRVLRVFLPTCTQTELKEFFGPVEQWIAEDETGKRYATYSFVSGALTPMIVAA